MSIDRNIPAPSARSKGKYTHIYEDMKQLQVGDSFATNFVDYKDEQSIRVSIRQKAYILRIKTTTRKVVEVGETVLRTWRIE